MQPAKLAIATITCSTNSAKYLPYFLDSIRSQSYQDFELLIADNSDQEDNENRNIVRASSQVIDFEWTGSNIGFSRAHNRLIDRAIERGADYFLVLNPDMICEPEMVETLLSALEADETLGAVVPKILKWDFENLAKTKIVDSLGLAIRPDHRFYDLGQGEPDRVIDRQRVFGFTGAGVMFRVTALRDVAFPNSGRLEYFDELMFMYKEDCDLSYRLFLAGYGVELIPESVCYHDRSVAIIGNSYLEIAKNRKNKNKQVKKWAFRNQLILVYKYWHLPHSLSTRIRTFIYQFVSLLFASLFERYLIQEFFDFLKIRSLIVRKRRALKLRISVRELQNFFSK